MSHDLSAIAAGSAHRRTPRPVQRESRRAEGSSQPAGVHTGMDPHLAEIMSKAWLEKGPALWRERKAASTQGSTDASWREGIAGV